MTRITDNASIVEMKTEIKDYKKLLSNKVLMRNLGVKPREKLKMELEIKKLEKKLEEIISIPDEFNRTFEGTGWIAYEGVKLEILENAIKIAKEESIIKAENLLVKYYTDKDEIQLRSHKVKRILKEREKLFSLALEEHFQERYYSSVPLFLMIIDGFVHEEEQTGFFAENTNLIAWDSIVGHSSGLSAVSKLMSQTRRKTNIEEIKIPYRNGILHGRDLNYANAHVSSKSLSIIFALSDWANAKKKMKSGKVTESYIPPTVEENIATLMKISENHELNMIQNDLLNSWEKRNIKVGFDVPKNGKKEEYEENSPERVLIEIFDLINDGNYGYLIKKFSYDESKITQGKKIQELKPKINSIKIEDFQLLEIVDQASAITVIRTLLTLRIENVLTPKEWNFRMAFADEKNNYLARGSSNGTWRIIDDFSNEFSNLKMFLS